MTKFEANNPEQLRAFTLELRMLYDKYHANLYLIDEVYNGVKMIEQAIEDKLI
jgi:hypothetical protein